MEILNPYISPIDRDIGMNQKAISLVWFPLCFDWVLRDKTSLTFFLQTRSLLVT